MSLFNFVIIISQLLTFYKDEIIYGKLVSINQSFVNWMGFNLVKLFVITGKVKSFPKYIV